MSTRWTVRLADKLSSWIITVGGIGTIVAVSAVFVFLVAVAVPLFTSGSREKAVHIPAAGNPLENAIHLAVDEYRVVGWALFRDGTLRVFRLDSGEVLLEDTLVNGDSLSAWSIDSVDGTVALGFLDGSVRLGRIGFRTDYPLASALPVSQRPASVGAVVTTEAGVVERTPEDQLRRQRFVASLENPLESIGGAAVARIDHSGGTFAVYRSDGLLQISVLEQTENLMTGDIEYEVTGGQVNTPFVETEYGLPASIAVSESGNEIFLVWNSGMIAGYDTRDLNELRFTGTTDVLDDDSRVTAFAMLLGGATFLLGDNNGGVSAVFRYNPRDEAEPRLHLARANRFRSEGAEVTAIAPSPRSRVFVTGSADGSVRMYQATSGARVLDFAVAGGGPVTNLVVTPKGDGLIVVTPAGLHSFDVNAGHPEATLRSMFRPIRYEGYEEAEHVWQSSSGTDDFEPKFGMWPLVFGTLKATFYSMLFGVPLALLAAIFTSEFLAPSLRSRIKTLIESMASLPSVVLGFLAALVIAPFVQGAIPATMVAFISIPVALLTGAYLWQLLPQAMWLRLAPARVVFVFVASAIGLLIAALLGPVVESTFFAGDLVLWLDGQTGTGTGGWFLILLPLCVLAVVAGTGKYAGPWFRRYVLRSKRHAVALADLSRFAVIVVASLLLTFLVAWMLNAFGADPRGPGAVFDTYVQRNALVVGFIMGFAVIPLIYTIAEDALTSVPDHLRAASLGAGATQWQTAIRIVLPTAMSGLFSAIMIGLGRAVGETMIVLMAAGNTPILEMNIFNGFRTLSANIAVELPEAVRDSTHYRTLFLAALILFAMTFVINTVAEMVRIRYRKRSSQL